jgi:hypothetical protein
MILCRFVGLATAILLVVTCHVRAADFSCPDPTKQVESDISGDVQGQAQGLLKLANAELKGEVKKAVVNLWEKYPNADRIAIVQNLQSTSCNLIKTSATLSDEQKIDKWIAMLQMFSGYLAPQK